MAIDEESRHQMYLRLEGVLGAEAAATMMEHLPPVGWADVATKRDLNYLGVELRLEFRNELKDVELRLERALRSMTNRFIPAVTIIAAIALTIARLA